mgnify:CR=1 FL=1
MGSVFVTQSDRTIKTFGGKEVAIPFFLQFVPGMVSNVVHSEESDRYGGPHTINTIIAKPHITDKLYKRRATLGEKDRYYPLFRTMNDIPSKGDPVLLCTIGKINYYLGPINTTTNSPTWNDDPSYTPEIQFEQPNKTLGTTEVELKGETQNFNKENNYKRLIKKRKEELDYGNAVFETTGDTIFEGRHGNSLRIGSRSDNPYIFISNNRSIKSSVESVVDGSLISITSNGTLSQHLGDGENVIFKLSSDTMDESNRYMGTLTSNVNNGQDVQELIYNYNTNQILFNSDRVTLNSKLDDIYLSSIKDIHIGTGRHLTISTNEDLIISSERSFIGDPTDREDTMESMVLGTTLLELLKETLAVIKSSQGICQGAPIPLADDTGAPGGVNAKITQIEQKIDQILSTKHFIEPNG